MSAVTLLGALLLLLGACDQPRPETASPPAQGATPAPAVNSAPPFTSYAQAINWVRSSLSCQSADTERSSWIRAAEYCTDGAGTGYAIFDLNGQEYIHAGVPEAVWSEFTEAPSMGRYYDGNIRGRYRLNVSGE